jgi:hypothetical protein
MIWPIKAILPVTLLRFFLSHFSSYLPSYLSHPLLDLHAAAELALFFHFLWKARSLTGSVPAASASYLYPDIDLQTNLPPFEHLKVSLTHLTSALKTSLPKSTTPAQMRARKQHELANWFTDKSLSGNAPATFGQLHRHHLSSWLAWAFHDCSLDDALEEELEPL